VRNARDRGSLQWLGASRACSLPVHELTRMTARRRIFGVNDSRPRGATRFRGPLANLIVAAIVGSVRRLNAAGVVTEAGLFAATRVDLELPSPMPW